MLGIAIYLLSHFSLHPACTLDAIRLHVAEVLLAISHTVVVLPFSQQPHLVFVVISVAEQSPVVYDHGLLPYTENAVAHALRVLFVPFLGPR